MTIGEFLGSATQQLRDAGIAMPRLDALLLVSDALQKDKSWVLAHEDTLLKKEVIGTLQAHLSARAKRIPLAYIREKAEFYGRDFTVNRHVLIPRPETETLVQMIKEYVRRGTLLDVGTGSGIIAITAKLENPRLTVEACDVSAAALQIAALNAKQLRAKVAFFQSDLLSNAEKQYDAIIANLPYVSRVWERSRETDAEPALALFADDDGLSLIYKLIAQTPKHLLRGGYLILEADPRQHEAIEKAAHEHGFKFVAAAGFGLVFAR